MRTHGLFCRTIGIAAAIICILVTIPPVSAKSENNVSAISGKVTGNVPKSRLQGHDPKAGYPV